MGDEKKYLEDLGYGNYRHGERLEDSNTLFDAMPEDGCYCCEYEGPLVLGRKGYICPECKELVLPLE